jgi:hypothetical protein
MVERPIGLDRGAAAHDTTGRDLPELENASPPSLATERILRCRNAMSGVRDPLDPARAYFADVEWEFHGDLIPLHAEFTPGQNLDRARRIDELSTALRSRIVGPRVRHPPFHYGRRPAFPVLDRQLAAAAREFSAIQRTLVLKHFGDVADPAALAAVDRAYEAFANGELARDVDLELFDCEPNSALYFLFAEFAFLAIEAGIDADFWSRLLPTLVRTQEIYAVVYGPASGERTFASYKVRNRIPASRAPLPLAKLESLRAAYSGLDVATLDLEACEIARRAFRDQI